VNIPDIVYHALLAVGGLLCVSIGGYAWRRDGRSAKLIVGLFAAIVYWIATTSLVIAYSGTPLGRTVARAQYVGITLTVLFVFVLAIEYTGREKHLTRRTVALFLVHPILTNVAVWVPPLRDQFRSFGALDPSTFYGYTYEFGPLFLGHTLYSYALIVTASVMYVRFAIRSDDIYRRQTVALIVGMITPWIGNILYVAGPLSVDITSLAFVVSGLVLWWAIFYQDLLEIVPVARSTVVDNINAGVVVLDRNDRIVDLNPRGRDLLGFDDETEIGMPVDDALDELPAVRDAYGELAGGDTDAETEVDAGARGFRVQVSPLHDGRDAILGRLLVIEDISGRKRRQRELERQNERLEQFASVVSHDLRNPLNVASSRLELGLETGDRVHFEQVAESHRRMDRIIDDVLTLAREGQVVTDTEEVSLADVATDAWNHVATADATLTVDDDRSLVADRARLQRAFENLFRNAVEHGTTDSDAETRQDTAEEDGPDVTVRVGTTTGGFYVADDGPGIPDSDREDVFEDGFTTSEDGTGFGLAIVESIVTAHGWTIDVTESEAGGARFEFDGVERPETTEGQRPVSYL
jgi:PAS domain S-box-containing protein